MYTIKVDGQVLYAPALYDDIEHLVLSPRMQLQQSQPGSLSFVVPPHHIMHSTIQVMKSIITVEMQGKEVFRGRATEVTTDTYNQTSVYCEGDLSYLLDSIQRPYEFEGTAPALFAMLVEQHNAQVDESKRFAVGVVDAVSASDAVKIESEGYTSTMEEITEWLLDQFGGRLVTRFEDGVCYLDYLDTFSEHGRIEFGVNLLDIENQINAQEHYTVLIPLGKTKDKKPLTIESVNGGNDYLEDAEAIAKYGRISKTYTWDYVTDAAELMALGEDRLHNTVTDNTLRITAVDFALLGVDADNIWIGDAVQITSDPHGVNRREVCIALDIDLQDPKNTVYTFGKVEETLTKKMVEQKRASGGAGRRVDELETQWAIIRQDIDEQNTVLSTVQIALDAETARIDLIAQTNTELEATIALKADRIELNGYVKAEDLEAQVLSVVESANIYKLTATTLNAYYLNGETAAITGGFTAGSVTSDGVTGGTVYCDYLHVGNYEYASKSKSLVTGVSVSASFGSANVMCADGTTKTISFVSNVTVTPTNETVRYLGR